MSSCIICGISIEFTDTNTKICGQDECEYKSRTMFNENDNYIFDFVNSSMNEAKFLLSTVKWSINSEKYKLLYTPVPYFLEFNEAETLLNIKTIFSKINIKNELNDIIEMKSDRMIFDNYGPIKYGLFKFTLKSNLMDFKNTNMFNIKSLIVYEVNHYTHNVAMFNKKVKKEGSSYLFHGSINPNWYSIMMNGLKNYSKTDRMTNGAAYGEGIYLSNTASLSAQYCRRGNIPKSGYVIGVFEVIGDIELYRKRNDIFVVNDDKKLRLKYILWDTSNKYTPDLYNQIDLKFGSTIKEEKQEAKQYYGNMRNKRLMVECKNAVNIDTKSTGLQFEINEENMLLWKVFITKIDEESELYKDMKKLNIKNIEMEIRFDTQYPIKPPFVRIVSPIFKYRTGHITLGGSICMELLTNQGWSPAYSIENLMIHIKSLILEGEGQIDPKKLNIEYSYEESQTAFRRMLLSHGWK